MIKIVGEGAIVTYIERLDQKADLAAIPPDFSNPLGLG